MEQIQAQPNYLPERDEDGQPMIDPAYYENIITDHIHDYITETGIERGKLTGNDFLAIFRTTQRDVFKPQRKTFPNKASNITYSTHNIQALFNLYIDICMQYKVYPSLFGFSILTGIQEDTTKQYLTPAQLEVTNLRREMLRNDLASDKMGRVVLANNDASFGLEYERKNTVERETIRRGLGVQDLPRLAET